ITLTINGHTTTVGDSGQTLNRGGIDPDICNKANEYTNWVALRVGGSRFAGALHHTRRHARKRHRGSVVRLTVKE
ncbi:MAG TPA: hypothetical protein VNZ05_00930, partial [Solirubrobacteraceae bacterium]|nr:hypothetical protein [Solirubrobacteraceae bacterium]